MGKTLLYNRYKLNEIAGEGGLGVVYKGFDTWVNKPVAIKKLKDINCQPSFINEYKWQSKLKADWIVKAHALHESNEGLHAVYEWLDGTTLDKAYGALKYSQLVDLLKNIVNMQVYLQNAGIVHNDIKPTNIFYIQRETGNYLKIGDFSFAVKNGNIGKMPGGTPYYMAPEYISSGIPTYETDLYSIGVVLLELLVGKEKANTIKSINNIKERTKAVRKYSILGGNMMVVTGIAQLLSLNAKERCLGIAGLKREFDNFRIITEKRNIDRNIDVPVDVYGREKEIEYFNNLINGTKDNKALVLYGEAGIGKSTLMHKYEDICRRKGWMVFKKTFNYEYFEGDTLDKFKKGITFTIKTLYPEINILLDELEESQSDKAWSVAIEKAVNIHPILICFDDYYKANETGKKLTADFIALAERLGNFHICIATRSLEELCKISGTFIELGALDRQEIKQLCYGVLKNKIDNKTAQYIYEISRGNPFWANKACRDMESNAGQNRQMPFTWDGAGNDENVTSILNAASVIGKIFDKNDLKQINSANGFEEKFAYLVKGDYFYHWNGDNYHWRHDIIKDHYYNSMAESVKRGLHENIAEYMEQKHKNDLKPIYEQLACNYHLGNNRKKAIKYLMLLGAHKEKVNANNEGIDVYKKALGLLEKPLNDEEHKMKLECLNQMADLYSSIGDYTNFIAIADRAKGMLPYVRDPELTVRTLNKYYFYEVYHNANFTKAGQICKDIIGLSAKMKYHRGKVLGYINLGVTYKNWGMYNKALAAYFKGYRLAHRLKIEHLKANALGNIAVAYFYNGDVNNAEKYFIKTLLLKNKLGLKTVSYEHLNLGELYADNGDLKKAEKTLLEAVKWKQKEEDLMGKALAYLGLARVYLIKDPSKAVNVIQKAANIGNELENNEVISGAMHLKALLFAMTGKAKKSGQMFAKSRALLGNAELHKTESYLAQAGIEAESGSLGRAGSLLGKITKETLDSTRTRSKHYKILGLVSMRRKNYKTAIVELKKGLVCSLKIRSHLNETEIKTLMAKCYDKNEDAGKARRNIDSAWRMAVKYSLNACKPEILRIKAGMTEKKGNYKAAMKLRYMAAEIEKTLKT
jgi:serine/threonine protein kinase